MSKFSYIKVKGGYCLVKTIFVSITPAHYYLIYREFVTDKFRVGKIIYFFSYLEGVTGLSVKLKVI